MTKKNEGKSQAEIYREERKARLAKANAKQAKKSPKRVKAEQTFTKVTPIVILCVAAVALFGWLLSFAGVPQRLATAMKVGDMKVSQAEYTYYYRSVASPFINMASQYDQYYGEGMGLQFVGYDSTKTPDKQEYKSTATNIELPEKEDGSKNTWEDFFVYHTKNTVQRYYALENEAKKAGFELTDADKEKIDENIKEIRESAASSNYSLNAYLRAMYGRGVSEKVVRNIMEQQLIVEAYMEKMTADISGTYSDADLEKAYNDKKDDYDVVTMRLFTFDASVTVEDNEGVEDTKKKEETAKADAKAKADKMLAAVKDEKTFKEQAILNAPEGKAEDYKADSATLMKNGSKSDLSQLGEDAQNWVFDSARKAGDKTVIETDNGYYVLYMVQPRHRNDDYTVNVRHILLSTEEAQDDAAKATVKKNAEDILNQWKSGDKTEDSFAALATEKTEDTGSKDNGGLYENVIRGKMVEEFDAWCFDEARKPGDTDIVETEYGYHIMYFVKKSDEPYWKTSVKEAKASADADAKLEELVKEEAYKLNEKNRVIKKVLKAANESFKMSAYNASK